MSNLIEKILKKNTGLRLDNEEERMVLASALKLEITGMIHAKWAIAEHDFTLECLMGLVEEL